MTRAVIFFFAFALLTSAAAPSGLGQLRREQTADRHRSDPDLQVREPARDDHGTGQ